MTKNLYLFFSCDYDMIKTALGDLLTKYKSFCFRQNQVKI